MANHQPLPVNPPIMNIDPTLNPQIQKDLEAYLLAMEMIREEEAKLKKMASELSHMKNAMFGVVMIMNEFQNVEGAKVSALSAVDNIDSDLRAAVSGGQGNINNIFGGSGTTPTKQQVEEAKKLMEFVKEMQAFIDAEKGKNGKGVIDGSTLKNLQEAINSIKDQFQYKDSNGKTVNDWGNPTKMAGDMVNWSNEAKKGTYPPQIKNLQFAFQELNQSTSALSTTTNTELQFTTQQFQQFLGMDESAMQAYQKGNLSMVNNQKSS